MKKIQETMENEIKIQRLEEAAKEATEEFSNLNHKNLLCLII